MKDANPLFVVGRRQHPLLRSLKIAAAGVRDIVDRKFSLAIVRLARKQPQGVHDGRLATVVRTNEYGRDSLLRQIYGNAPEKTKVSNGYSF